MLHPSRLFPLDERVDQYKLLKMLIIRLSDSNQFSRTQETQIMLNNFPVIFVGLPRDVWRWGDPWVPRDTETSIPALSTLLPLLALALNIRSIIRS